MNYIQIIVRLLLSIGLLFSFWVTMLCKSCNNDFCLYAIDSVPCEGYALSWSRPHQFHDESLQPNSFKRTLYSITFLGTEEWAKPNNLRFATIINVIPLQLDRGYEFSRFYEAVITKVVVPFEQLLNQLEPPVTYILANVELSWRIRIGNSMNIPVASLFPFPILHYWPCYTLPRTWMQLSRKN